ncbi:MAG: hypothetical protein IH866_02735 [Chloroflexi bacterium]|nr:hypothetical protein [Chloroflexota bacterium]
MNLREQVSFRPLAAFVAVGGIAFFTLLYYSRLPSVLPGYPAVVVASALWLILPGWFLQRALFSTRRTGVIERIAAAFLMSIALAALPGLAALRLHWSLDAFALSYGAFAAIASGIALMWRPDREAETNEDEGTGEPRSVFSNLPLLLLIGVPLLAILTSPFWSGDRIARDADDLVYMAYVNEYSRGDALDASGPFLDTRPGAFGRMQINVWVVLQALVTDSAGVEPIDLLLSYLPPLMTALAVVAMFTLAKGLFRRTPIALLAALFVLVYAATDMASHDGYGRNIFLRIGEDKMVAAFVLLPVALLIGAKYLSRPTFRGYLLLILAIGAIFVVHPMVVSFLGIALVSLAALRVLIERSRSAVVSAAALALPWVVQAAAFLVWSWRRSGGVFPDQLVGDEYVFRREIHIVDVGGGLIIGNYHLLLHPFVIAAIVLALPVWLVARRGIGNQVMLASVLGVLVVFFVPIVATPVADAITEQGVWRLHWLISAPLILAYALHEAVNWVLSRWPEQAQPQRLFGVGRRIAPVTAVVLVVGAAVLVQEHYANVDNGTFYNRTSPARLLPWTEGSIFLGGVERMFSSDWRLPESGREVLKHLDKNVAPGSEVLTYLWISRFFPGALDNVRPVDYEGAPDLGARSELVTALQNGALSEADIEQAMSVYGIGAVVVVIKDRLPIDNSPRSFARYDARVWQPRAGEPTLESHQNGAGEPYWAFGAIERERVGGQRFTVPDGVDPEDHSVQFRIELAASERVSGDQTVRIVVSYWQVDEAAEFGGEEAAANAVADVVLEGGTAVGEAVLVLRTPGTQFVAGETYEMTVWRSPNAEEDTYPADVWFIGLDVLGPRPNLEQIDGTAFYLYQAFP